MDWTKSITLKFYRAFFSIFLLFFFSLHFIHFKWEITILFTQVNQIGNRHNWIAFISFLLQLQQNAIAPFTKSYFFGLNWIIQNFENKQSPIMTSGKIKKLTSKELFCYFIRKSKHFVCYFHVIISQILRKNYITK